MLYRPEVRMEPIDISTVSKGLISLLILCSTALIISAAMDMASTPFCGSAAWAFLPVTRISSLSDDAMIGPGFTAISPTLSSGHICNP